MFQKQKNKISKCNWYVKKVITNVLYIYSTVDFSITGTSFRLFFGVLVDKIISRHAT
jgi:hypothetical protein